MYMKGLQNTNMKVLVVDDSQAMRTAIKLFLKELGCTHIAEADDGERAIAMLQSGEFGLVISDWNMPGMDGIELLKMVRQDDRLKNMPFLMISADGENKKITEAIRAGADGYMVKPVSDETLLQNIMKAFARHLWQHKDMPNEMGVETPAGDDK